MGVYNVVRLPQISNVTGWLLNETVDESNTNVTHIRDADNASGGKIDKVQYVFSVLGILITLGTIIGNVLVIVAVLKEKKLRKVGNVFVINLALSDCLVGVFVTPLAIVYEIAGKWVLPWPVCDVWVGMDVFCCTASILNLCAISYDRCNAIVHPIKYARKRTYSRAWRIVLLVWIYAIVIAVPQFFIKSNNVTGGAKNDQCRINGNVLYTLFSTIGAYFLPLICTLYFYTKIYTVSRGRRSEWKHRRGCSHFIGKSSASTIRKTSPCCFSLPCCKNAPVDETEISPPEEAPQDIEANEVIQTESGEEQHDDTDRQEAIDPALMAIYQMRQRSQRNMSTATTSSFGSTFYSSTDSSNTATTSFSDSSDRSCSISSGRSMSTSTEGRLSFGSPSDSSRRHSSIFKPHRLSGARHSALQTEVIHELVVSQAETLEEVLQVVEGKPLEDKIEEEHSDEGNDEESDEPVPKAKTRSVLKSATFRHRNSRKRKKIAMSQEKRAAKTLGIVMGCFITCWLPFFLVALIRPFCTNCFFHPYLLQGVAWLGYLNSICNPVIYSFFNKDFRNAFKKITCSKTSEVYL